jgi:hypothetical protein
MNALDYESLIDDKRIDDALPDPPDISHDYCVLLYKLGYIKRVAEFIGDNRNQIDIGYRNAEADLRAGRLREWDMTPEVVEYLRRTTTWPILDRESWQRAT